jgi:hypothetical protein
LLVIELVEDPVRAGHIETARGDAALRGLRPLRHALGRSDEDQQLSALRERAPLLAGLELLIGRRDPLIELLLELVHGSLQLRIPLGPEEGHEALRLLVRRERLPRLLLRVGGEVGELGRLVPVLELDEVRTRGCGEREHTQSRHGPDRQSKLFHKSPQ